MHLLMHCFVQRRLVRHPVNLAMFTQDSPARLKSQLRSLALESLESLAPLAIPPALFSIASVQHASHESVGHLCVLI